MSFCNQPHQFYCGVDLHARTMYLSSLDGAVQPSPFVVMNIGPAW